MSLPVLDAAAIAHGLGVLAERAEDRAEAYFERTEELRLLPGEAGAEPVERREEGFAVRLVRGRQTWMAVRDGFEPEQFAAALRQVARSWSGAPGREARFEPVDLSAADGDGLGAFAPAVERAIRRRHHAAFPVRLTVGRHRRWCRVIDQQVDSGEQAETFFSVRARLPWGEHGALLTRLGRPQAEALAEALVERFRARDAPPPAGGKVDIVLEPAAAAVFLHEAVAHALEVDTLAISGRPERAIGVRLAPAGIGVLDDPTSMPAGLRRSTDDEGVSVERRWLLRDGVVEQPLADTAWATRCERLAPGAGRRTDRFTLPAPRSYHLELLPGEGEATDLTAEAEGGLFITSVERGRLDPWTGEFRLDVPFARRITSGGPGGFVGRFRLGGTVSDLLGAIAQIGSEPRLAGAGWCAKNGQRLPVWATCPAVRLEGVRLG